jgi:hypothetical protein
MGSSFPTLLDLEVAIFASQLSEVVIPLFDATDQHLTDWQKKVDADYCEAISHSKDDADEANARGEAAYRETTVSEQRQLIGAACLGFVATALNGCLEDMGRYFKRSHPPERKYVGRSWLQKRQDEYQGRFQIDFSKSPVKISKIEEVILARNAGLHWDGTALKEYRRRVANPRFIKQELLAIERDNFLDAVADVQAFVDWVHAELKKLTAKSPVEQK